MQFFHLIFLKLAYQYIPKKKIIKKKILHVFFNYKIFKINLYNLFKPVDKKLNGSLIPYKYFNAFVKKIKKKKKLLSK